ncbi:GNAT family N-acetyltransferase [Paenibacillus sp. FA6]|uniref:GNAT family N-acetyltransferase n=1 Tax=Paenibacillus sp. FA6 TaxID=3413029 RepID=UPI003F65BC5F
MIKLRKGGITTGLIKIENPIWSGQIKEILSENDERIFGGFECDDNAKLDDNWWFIDTPDSNQPCGLVWIVNYEDEKFYENKGEIAEISFCVKKDFRGRGILKTCMSEIEEIVRTQYDKATLILAVVKKTNPNIAIVTNILIAAGYSLSENRGNNLLQKTVNRVDGN